MGDTFTNENTSQADPSAPIPRPRRPENIPPARKFGPSSHQASKSHEDEQRRLRYGGKPRAPNTLDVFADPPDGRRTRRPRRNSDSSLVDKNEKRASSTERKREWARKADAERRQLREAQRDGITPRPVTASKASKPSKRLDIIDQLDVTSIYGTGCG